MMRKKILFGLVICVLLISLSIIPVSAKNGDIAGAVYYTDIRAYINSHPIESYNVDGYTAICAEDLAAYGFCVHWYAESRLLIITPNTEYASAPPEYTFPEVAKPAGTYRMPYLETDIQVLADGKAISSWNIDGRTLIRLQDLTMFGVTVWDAEARTSSFTAVPRWTMLYYIATAPILDADKTFITEFDLTFSLDQIPGQFSLGGIHASYFDPYSLQWEFYGSGAEVRFVFSQNQPGLNLVQQAIDKCTNWDYRGNYPGFPMEPKADIADIMTITINGEEKQIRTVGITQGNGHVDYILTVDGSYPREEVSSVSITCSIPEDMLN